ncbi:endocuticle structural glycoprotein SgAbd-5-like [Choristoneura fumiferana]|uniref:endocuticle structural glycoprotein SgAbd-5-like n=1 Tax=Choristoneura fumiferana TaxID=7141 RepID=UPI003D15E786
MKLLVVVALVMSVAAAAPQQRPQRQSQGAGSEVQILRFDSDNNGIDSYNFAYEQSNGQKQQEQGELRNAGAENESIAVKGSYAWVGPDGVTYIVTYVADENGFQPTIEQGPGGAVPGAVVASLLG